nr:DEAD/DEAH box helicase [Brevibacillus panacihumi]
MATFLSLGIGLPLHDTLKANGITESTPVQEKAIPLLLAGKDVIAQAQTGTGKTLAFLLPILEKADPHVEHVQALILTPTRELALQITTEAKKLLAQLDDIHVLAVYGGQDVERQMKKLRGKKQIVIATPGRLLDHLRRGTIELSTVSMLVLDEADQMLHMGFLPEVEEIIGCTSGDRQTMLFSATMPAQVRSLAKRYMRNPEDVRVQGKQITLKDIRQIAVETTDRAKQSALRELIEQQRPFMAVIFCRTKRRASALNAALQGYGYLSDELHGDLSQAKREDVMKRFREARLQLLVATDVAARGLDVEGVTHVFNYDIPHDVESYIHRIGRTGRAGEQGVAITLVAPKDRMHLEMIESGIRMPLEKRRMETAQPKKEQTSQESRGQRGAKAEQRKEKGRPPVRGQGGGPRSNSDSRRQGQKKRSQAARSERPAKRNARTRSR